MRSEQETNEAIERYGDTVRRLCMLHLKHEADAQDVFQTVFLKYLLHTADFESREHEKAWFIRVTINACRDVLKSVFRRRTVSLESAAELPAQLTDENREVLRAVRALPPQVPGGGVSPLLRRLYRPGDRKHPAQERKYHLYQSDPGQRTAQDHAGR